MAKRSSKKQPDNPDVVVSDVDDSGSSAADLVRQKVARAYEDEPSASQEIKEDQDLNKRSKHQQFMHQLSTSGDDLATIQTKWHDYYTNLPDDEKYEVWQEFYDSQGNLKQKPKLIDPAETQKLAAHKQEAAKPKSTPTKRLRDSRSKEEVQTAIKDKVTAGGKLNAKHHMQSLLFGLGMGFVVIFIFLFGFFNQIIIAPFIQPSRTSADTPIIINSSGIAPTTTPEVIIPKINVQIPVDYSETSTNENTIENDLEDGVVHYPTTVLPGQIGNAAFFGHSSNNIFNPGKYKFAFVLLHTILKGDTFYLTYNDKVYVYKVISTAIVSPSDVGVLASVPGQTATATLITCDPPGTSINRLIVVGQQISPDPSTNSVSTASANTNEPVPTQLPNDGASLWSRVTHGLIGKLAMILLILTIIAYFAWQIVRNLDWL